MTMLYAVTKITVLCSTQYFITAFIMHASPVLFIKFVKKHFSPTMHMISAFSCDFGCFNVQMTKYFCRISFMMRSCADVPPEHWF